MKKNTLISKLLNKLRIKKNRNKKKENKKISSSNDTIIKIKLNGKDIQSIPLKVIYSNNNEGNELAPPPPPNSIDINMKGINPAKYACILKNKNNYFNINSSLFTSTYNKLLLNIYLQGNVNDQITYEVSTDGGYNIISDNNIDDSGTSYMQIYITKEIEKGCDIKYNSQGIKNYNYSPWISENAINNDDLCNPIGGISKNEFVSMADAIKIAKYSVGLITLTKEEIKIGDTNGSNRVDIGDALNIARFCAGLNNSLKN